jgi:hypothetical protein
MRLHNKTPAEAAGIDLRLDNKNPARDIIQTSAIASLKENNFSALWIISWAKEWRG